MRLPRPTTGPVYADLDRPPLQQRLLHSALARSPFWREIHVLPTTPSTNEMVLTAARAGEPEGLVVVAELQTSGRGRLDRTWVSPPRAGLTFSVLLRPAVSRARRSVLPLLAGVAVSRAIAERSGIAVGLKWPNDVVVDGRKLGGLLAEATGDAVALGIGLNISTRPDELPSADATSLALETGGVVDRPPVLLAVLRALADDYAAWCAADGEPTRVLESYRAACTTLGAEVSVSLPSGATLVGVAVDVDDTGALVVEADGSRTAVSAGDVVHVRRR